MTKSSRVHDRSHFFKFTSFDTAIKIIESKSFCWSSPVCFNDPFDTQMGFTLNYDEKIFAKHLSESMLRVIYSDQPIEGKLSSKYHNFFKLFRENRDKLPKDKLASQLLTSAFISAEILTHLFDDYNKLINEHLLHSRVFCVTEQLKNVVMWSHYAEQHKGVVFKLSCNDEIDNSLLIAKKINYTNNFVAFPNSEEFACSVTGEKLLDIPRLVQEIAHTKHTDWQYEEEWRVHVPMLDDLVGTGKSFYPENPKIFEAIYLGCKIEEKKAKNIVEFARKELPNMKILQAVRSKSSYELTFESLN